MGGWVKGKGGWTVDGREKKTSVFSNNFFLFPLSIVIYGYFP